MRSGRPKIYAIYSRYYFNYKVGVVHFFNIKKILYKKLEIMAIMKKKTNEAIAPWKVLLSIAPKGGSLS